MNNKHGYRNFYWSDNTPANYFKWNTREPSWGWGKCIEIVPYRWAAGRWNAVYCSKLNGYICKKGLFQKSTLWSHMTLNCCFNIKGFKVQYTVLPKFKNKAPSVEQWKYNILFHSLEYNSILYFFLFHYLALFSFQ